MGQFRTALGEAIFNQKYAHEKAQTWAEMADTAVEDVIGERLSKESKDELKRLIREMKFIPGGRYLRNVGRELKFFSNCFALRAEQDTREDWADLSWKAESCLISGGGIGIDYSVYRGRNASLSRTGGKASGPVPKMEMINEIGRRVMQGGDRRSAMYASLNWVHSDAFEFLHAKDWENHLIPGTTTSLKQVKEIDFNWPAPLDMTNVSLNYDDAWLATPNRAKHPTFRDNVRQALRTAEPGFSFNFGKQENHTLRNACVPGEAQILTKAGYRRIDSLVGQTVSVWNGEEWAEVTPFETGVQELLRVILSDGTSLVCTPNHNFCIDGPGYHRPTKSMVSAEDLRPGDKLTKFDMPVVAEGTDPSGDAYSQGFYSGDGTTGLEQSWVFFTKYCCIDRLKGTFRPRVGEQDKRAWKHGPMLDKSFVPVNASLPYRLNWLAGIIDSDGCVTRDKNGNGIQIGSVQRKFLEDIRLMLTTLGVRAKVVGGNVAGWRPMPDGHGGTKEYFCQDAHRLLIGNEDTYQLVRLGLKCSRADVQELKPQRDARRFVTVLSVEDTARIEPTYCFTEPKTSRGTFNGIVTGQCTEFITDDDGDVCNLGSVNMANCESLSEFRTACYLGAMFLYCGTVSGLVPYDQIRETRDRNRRIGLGIMGVHEWLIQRGYRYEVVPEMHLWLDSYQRQSDLGANKMAYALGLPRPKAVRAIAPTGTIGIIAGTTTGIEPVFAVAYKRRYLKAGSEWHYQYVIDSAAKDLIERYGTDPSKIESAIDLAQEVERRIKFQADVQDYVDMGISSTINIPAWGSDLNNEDRVDAMAQVISEYAPRLRGLTFYPDGSRGGQPLTAVPYGEAEAMEGLEFKEHDSCRGGVCGI